jgi:hypothetical protein
MVLPSHFPNSSPDLPKEIKKTINKHAVKFIDAGWKPDDTSNKYLKDALSREYERRLRLDIENYPPKRIERYTKKKNLLMFSWRQLEKIRDALKRGRTHKKRKKRKRRKSRRRKH